MLQVTAKTGEYVVDAVYRALEKAYTRKQKVRLTIAQFVTIVRPSDFPPDILADWDDYLERFRK